MECINQVGLNNFVKLKKLRLEHLETDPKFDEAYQTFLSSLRQNTSIVFVKLERLFT